MKVDDGKECLCSSLAINCFQLGCFMHKRPRCHCDHDNQDWMTKLTELAPEKKLRDLVIPGTHDSASGTVNRWAPFAAVGICQNVSVLEQLRRGARYLDLRIGGKADSTLVDDIVIIHGHLKGAPFPNIVEEIDQFLKDNPGEFVILDIIYDKNKHDMSPEQRIGAFKLISSTFNQMITKDDANSWFNLKKVTLGDLAEKKKNALLLIGGGILDFSYDGTEYDLSTITREFGCHRNDRCMKNKWHNTANARTLLESNETFLEEGSSKSNKFLNSQFVMTPQPPGGAMDVFGLLFGTKSLRPVSLARELYRKDLLESYIRDNAEKRWNIVLLDFPDLCPQLVRFIIGLNSPKHLKIKEAIVTLSNGDDTIDVTKTANKLRSRKSCLYLLDFKQDLELSGDEGTLTLKGQFDDEDLDEYVIAFNRDTEFLLCDT